jgi:hypothetical protein
MTTIITRLYESDASAQAVVSGLAEAGFPEKTYETIDNSGNPVADMEAAGVDADAAAAYAAKMGQGNKLVVVRAPFVPFGAAREAMRIADSEPAMDAGVSNENVLIREEQVETSFPKIQRNKRYGDFLFPLLSKRRPPEYSVYEGTKRFGAFLVPLLSDRKPMDNSIYREEKRFGDFLVPLLSKRKPRGDSVFHGTKHFADFLAPLIVRR